MKPDTDPLAALSDAQRHQLPEAGTRPAPMLATLTEQRFDDDNWVFEHKFDGMRCLASCRDGTIRLVSHNDKPQNDTWQELVIGGYTDPQGARTGFGALLLGYHGNGGLRDAGRVGTGFDDKLLKTLHQHLAQRQRASSPFEATTLADDGDIHGVRPDLVAAIGFTEWTDAGRLRHPRFPGLLHDKSADEVMRERAS